MASTLSFRPAGDSGDEYSDDDLYFGDDNDYSAADVNFISDSSCKKSNFGKSSGGFGLPSKPTSNGFPNKTSFSRSQKRPHTGPKVITTKEDKPLPIDDFRNVVMWGQTENIQKYLDQGIAVDTVLRAGWTALMYAANRGNVAAVNLLLENGANPNYQASSGQYSVLMAACSSNIQDEASILQCVEVLLEAGASVNDFDRFHMSPVMYASKEGRALVVQKLIEHQASLSKQDSRGYGALMWAASKGHLRVVQVLLEGGADPNMQTSNGSRAADVALAAGHDVVHKVLSGYHKEDEDALQIVESIVKEQPVQKQTSALTTASSGSVVYGDLELFLSGLQLGDLIPVFQEQDVSFPRFLQLTDKDLLQLGVSKIGQRKKILDAIRDTHKKEWETTSVASIHYNKQISCPEAVAMVSNISKHASYIGATVGYVSDQIGEHPDILRSGQEGATVDELMVHTEQALTNIRILYFEFSQLAKHVAKATSKEDFHPPDLLLKKSRKKQQRIRRIVLLTSAGLGVVGVCIWGRNYVQRLCVNLFTTVVP